jgi:peroxiredoxin
VTRLTLLLLLLSFACACGGGGSNASAPGAASSSSPPSKEDKVGADDAVGKKAPTFTIRSPATKEPITYAPNGTKPTLLYFWATWSAPGAVGLTKLSEVHRNLGEKNIDIIAISIDDDGKEVPTMAKERGAHFPVGWDESHKVANRYTIDGEPIIFIIDKDGIIRHRHRGLHDNDDKIFERELRALMRY